MSTTETKATGWRESEAEVAAGTIRYREAGSGPTLVFVHGALVDGQIWNATAERLTDGYRCVVPDLPMGSHRAPIRPEADLTPPGQGTVVADFLRAVDAEDAILIGNDSGGSALQMLVSGRPEAIPGVRGLVLTNTDAFDNFPPGRYKHLFRFVALSPATVWLLTQTFRLPANRRSPLAYPPLAKTRIPGELLERWVRPGIESAEVRRDTLKLLRGADPALTIKAAEELPGFDRPTLFAWATDDRFFPLEHAERLAASMPDARVAPIPDAKTFVMLDQPEALAGEIAEFAGSIR